MDIPKSEMEFIPSALMRIGSLKTHPLDLVKDFIKIYKNYLQRFKDSGNGEMLDYIEAQIDALNQYANNIGLANARRIYMVTTIDTLRVMLYNLEKCVVDTIKDCLQYKDVRQTNEENGIPTAHITTVFIFEGDRITFQCDLGPDDAVSFALAFYKENLYDYRIARRNLYLNPLQQERKHYMNR